MYPGIKIKVRKELKAAHTLCSERGLHVASRWAAELLISMEDEESNPTQPLASAADELRPPLAPDISMEFEDETRKRDASIHIIQVPEGKAEDINLNPVLPKKSNLGPDEVERILEEQEEDFYLLGKAYFDDKEFENASLLLRDCHSAKCIFLRCYSRFLALEKTSRIQHGQLFSPTDRSTTFQPEMIDIIADIDKKLNDMALRAQRPCGFLLYLKGVVSVCCSRRKDAIACLVKSVNAYSYNWSAWEKLCELYASAQECHEFQAALPNPTLCEPFTVFYQIQATMEIHSASELLRPFLVALIKLFPKSKTLEGMSALTAYHLREFEIAAGIYQDIFKSDPYRLDDVDLYSNILYMMEQKGKLAQLARQYSEIDVSRPETSCLIGNYFSATHDHAAAKDMFMNALKMDLNYLSAWTLLGHEFIEQKNKAACVEGYRRALCTNLKDYRAWFGLGQEYMADMAHHALWYFSRATASRPYDVRMWQNLGEVYARLGRHHEAIRCFKRALISCEPGEVQMPIKIAKLYEQLGVYEEALKFHSLVADIVDFGVCTKPEKQEEHVAAGRVFIAKYAITKWQQMGSIQARERAKVLIFKAIRYATDRNVSLLPSYSQLFHNICR
ncbi:TPR-like protein [Atractiella rhizophila]|nr:TPR-like protein [Atractiella rhizophila]